MSDPTVNGPDESLGEENSAPTPQMPASAPAPKPAPVPSVGEGIWERQDNEGSEAYRAFCFYRDMGPARTLNDAYRQATGKPDAEQASGCWKGWYKDYDWKRRAETWDIRLEKLARDKAEAEAMAELEDYRKRLRNVARINLAAALQLAQLGDKRLQELLRQATLENIKPSTMANIFRASAAAADAAINAEAMAMGVGEILKGLYADANSDRS